VRARAASTWTAIHASSETAGRWVNHIEFFVVRIGDLEGRNKPPAIFLDISQMLFSAEDTGLLQAAKFAGGHAAARGSVDFNQVRIGFCVLDDHIKRMARSKAASTEERKIFFRFSNLFSSDEIFEVRPGNAAEEFLHPPPAIVPNFHSFAATQRSVHLLVPKTSVHFFHCRRN